MEMNDRKPYCILSLDGGGIRGLVSSILLEYLETQLQAKTNNPNALLKDFFHFIAGTSTGSIIACAVSQGIPTPHIKSVYLDRAEEIFPRSWRFWKSLLGRLLTGGPMFDDIGLERVLKDEVGDRPFKELSRPTLVTSFDTLNRQDVVFKNTKLAHQNIPVWQICRSSSAAPVAFPGFAMGDRDFLAEWQKDGNKIDSKANPPGIPLIDGGVIANDPALCAIAERLSWNKKPPAELSGRDRPWIEPGYEKVELHDIIVASFGTGEPTVDGLDIAKATHWGAVKWVNPLNGVPLVDVLFEGSIDSTNYIATSILTPDNYFRFQPEIERKTSAFSASQSNLAQLERNARDCLARSDIQKELDRLIEILTRPQPVPQT